MAKQGYGLEALVYDDSKNVRLEVAKQGYGFDILIENSWNDDEDDRTNQILCE